MIRTFIAIELPEQIKTELGKIQNELRTAAADVGWTKPANIHLTLKFLGDLDEKRVEVLRRVTSESVKTEKPFELVIGSIGFFPGQKRTRVIWVGLEGDRAELNQVHEKLDRDLAAAGFPVEDRAFSPHLTIGRVRTPKNLDALIAKSSEIVFKPIPFRVDQITIMRSQLHPSGAIYTAIEKCPLSGTDL